MASLGSFLLLATFVVCSYAAVTSVVGARRRSRQLIESGIGAFYLVAALMTCASAVMINAFLTDDFSIRYVSHYSDSVQPLFYKITSYWGRLDGSIMFWVFLLSIFGSSAVWVNRERHRELIPYVVATISTVQMFFLYLMVVHKNPFSTFLTNAPADGPQPRIVEVSRNQRGDAERKRNRHPDEAGVERRRMNHHPVVLKQGIEPLAVCRHVGQEGRERVLVDHHQIQEEHLHG